MFTFAYKFLSNLNTAFDLIVNNDRLKKTTKNKINKIFEEDKVYFQVFDLI